MLTNKRNGWLYESCNKVARPIQVKGWGKSVRKRHKAMIAACKAALLGEKI